MFELFESIWVALRFSAIFGEIQLGGRCQKY